MAIALPIVILLSLSFTGPQAKSHRIVFEVNVPGAMQYQGVLGNIANLRRALSPDSIEIEVVCMGAGIKMVLAKDNRLAGQIKKAQQTGVIFVGCSNTIKAMHLRREDLFSFVRTVDAGIAEVVRKQESGWSYIKAGS